MMIQAIENECERSAPPSPKRPKLEEPPKVEQVSYDSDEWETLSEDSRLLEEEWDKSKGFDVDFSKLRYTFGCGAVDLDGCGLASEPHETNRDLLDMLSQMAISYYKDKTDISLEYVKVLRANYHPSAGVTMYMTFEANDPSDGNQTKRYQAVVRYLPCDIRICSCRLESSS